MKRNKLYGMVLAASLSTGFTLAPVFTPPSAAQGPQTNQAANGIGTLLLGLINVDVTNVAVNIGNITVLDVNNVLNHNQIDVLRNAIINIPIASYNQNVLNGLLQNAKLITGNTIVVGVLGGVIYVLPLP